MLICDEEFCTENAELEVLEKGNNLLKFKTNYEVYYPKIFFPYAIDLIS